MRPSQRCEALLLLCCMAGSGSGCGAGNLGNNPPEDGAVSSPRSADDGAVGSQLADASSAQAAAGSSATGSPTTTGSASEQGGTSGGTDDAATPAGAGADAALNAEDASTGTAGDAAMEQAAAGLFACPDQDPTTSPLPATAVAALVDTEAEFIFTEGPVWVAEQQSLFFTDMRMGESPGSWPRSSVYQLRLDGSVSKLVDANSNGLALAPDGRLLAATHDIQALSYLDPVSGDREEWLLTWTDPAEPETAKHFNSPNDLTVRSDGWVYFTDPDWQLGDDRKPSETGFQGVYRVKIGEAEPVVSLVSRDLTQPNGISLSPDEAWLYVGAANAVYRYEVQGDGSLGERTVFVESQGSDGMAVDCLGNLYLTGENVHVYRPDGTLLGVIEVPATTTNLAFGGADRKTLYITTSGGWPPSAGKRLYAIALELPGSPY